MSYDEPERPEDAEGPSLVAQLGSAPNVLQDNEIDLPLLTKNQGLEGTKSLLTVQVKAPSPLQALLHTGVFKAAIQ